MASQIFLNLPVKNLDASVAFFTKMGYTFNAQFTNADATCMIVNEHIYVMLLVKPFFKTFVTKKIADAHKTVQMLVGLSFDSKDDVNKMVDAAIAAGAVEAREPLDHGFMYTRAFNDLDGHIWEMFWMDPSAVQGQ
jgi:predicted lactoylglutathione lyase